MKDSIARSARVIFGNLAAARAINRLLSEDGFCDAAGQSLHQKNRPTKAGAHQPALDKYVIGPRRLRAVVAHPTRCERHTTII
jgi:hypothetical protein